MIAAMEGHRTAERRSLAYHRAVADRLEADPRIIDLARTRVLQWCTSGEVNAAYAESWKRLLELEVPELRALLVDESEQMTALRQVSPFSGAIDPRTRWQIWRSVE